MTRDQVNQAGYSEKVNELQGRIIDADMALWGLRKGSPEAEAILADRSAAYVELAEIDSRIREIAETAVRLEKARALIAEYETEKEML